MTFYTRGHTNLGFNPQNARQKIVEDMMSSGFSYSRKLTGHSSCVNTLAFSSGGRWLASAGDDHYVHIFDFHQEDVQVPSCSFVAPRSNVFSLCFSANNRHLYCGATDDPIFKYDLTNLSDLTRTSTCPPASEIFRDHRAGIRDITCHPSQDEVVMSASEDGRIILRDGRIKNYATRAEGTIQNESEFTGVRWNPQMDKLFATSDNRGRVCLRDLRTAFGPLSSRSSQPLLQYVTSVSSPRVRDALSRPEASSIVWDRDGTQLAVTLLNYFPVIFSLTDKWPVALCSAPFLPDGSPVPPGERSYSNSCTIKHGSFGGLAFDRDSYYTAPSDDFRGYVWKIPDAKILQQQRREISADDWDFENDNTIAFAQNIHGPRYMPTNLSTPAFRLNGHRSIVNTALFHPNLLHIVTAGIERNIILHSPTSSSPCTKDLAESSTHVRPLPEGSVEDRLRFVQALVNGDPLDHEADDDHEAIALFDEYYHISSVLLPRYG